jgi:ferredoxin-NADP reductase
VRLALDGAELLYRAGQAAMIGVADRNERVPYSIASAPEETRAHGALEFLIKVEPSGRWGHQFDRIARGMHIAVQGPYGTFGFPERPVERSFLFVAGGTGVAPLRAMIRHALLAHVPGRLRLLYSARSPEDFPYLSELRGLDRRKQLDLRVTATRGELPGTWRGARGRIDASHLAPLVDAIPTLCFVCGPAAMVDAVPRMLQELGIERERIRIEEW